jgi:hypothetical protein
MVPLAQISIAAYSSQDLFLLHIDHDLLVWFHPKIKHYHFSSWGMKLQTLFKNNPQ